MVPEDRLREITDRFEFLEARLNAGADGAEIAKLATEYAELKPVVAQIAEWRQVRADIAEAEAMTADPEMAELAEEELPLLRARLPEVQGQAVGRYDLEGWSHAEVAEMLGISVLMSRRHVSDGRKRLREELGPERPEEESS